MDKLKSRVAWIIGATGDIGRDTSSKLIEDGYRVSISYNSSIDVALQIKHQAKFKDQVNVVELDVKSEDSIKEAYEKVCLSHGYPEIIIYACGNSKHGLIQDMTSEDYEEIMNMHVKGLFNVVQCSLSNLINNKKGRIIIISSIWGETGAAGEVLYSAAKGAQNSFVKSLAKELAPSSITVNAIAPGAITSRMVEKQLNTEDRISLESEIPLCRLGTPNDISSLVKYLASENSSYITGQVIGVNGGWYT